MNTSAHLQGPDERGMVSPSDAEIHIINRFENPSGGSEWHALFLYRELAPHAHTTLWSSGPPHPVFTREAPIERVNTWRRHFPAAGTVIVVGVYFPYGLWAALMRAQRVVLEYNTFQRRRLDGVLALLGRLGTRPVDLVFQSDRIARDAGRPGRIAYSPIDLQRFSPAAQGPRREAFTIGRLSRDDAAKHHPLDPALYRRLGQDGCRVRVMGGTCLLPALRGAPGVEVLPACAEDAVEFLRGLDCFLYRTDTSWTEPHGRVITEAMACGVPVIAHRKGGYADFIEHGENGFLFDGDHEALAIIDTLRRDDELRARIAAAGRVTVERILGPRAREAALRYYLS